MGAVGPTQDLQALLLSLRRLDLLAMDHCGAPLQPASSILPWHGAPAAPEDGAVICRLL